MHRFFANKESLEKGEFVLEKEDLNHGINVLRLKAGEQIVLCDGQKTDYICQVKIISKREMFLELIEKKANENEPKHRITLFQGLTKSDKTELVIQKCVEIGVSRIVPVECARSVSKIKEKADKSKVERWNKIAESAAKQSMRGIIPVVEEMVTFKEALEKMKNFPLGIMPYELEENFGIKQALSGFDGEEIAIFIGPEGGIADEEAKSCIDSGIKSVTLGKRILRTETAGLAALTMVLYELGDM